VPTPDQLGQGQPSIVPAAILTVVGGVLVVLGLLVVLAVLVIANRADPDESGRRPLTAYYFGVSFLTLFASLFGSFVIVLGLVQLIGHHSGFGQRPALHPVGDAVARVAIVAGIVTAVALVLLVVHVRRGLEVSGRADPRTGPLGRLAQSYVATVSFVAVVVTAVSLVVVLDELARIIAPGVFEVSGTRVETLRPLLAAAYLALAALAVLWAHMRLVPRDVRHTAWPSPGAAPPAHGAHAVGSSHAPAPYASPGAAAAPGPVPPSGPFPPPGPVPPAGASPGAGGA
jgi:hypothetical protein